MVGKFGTIQAKVVYLDNYNGGEDNEKLGYKHDGDSGFDLRAGISEPMVIKPFERVIVPSGVKIVVDKFAEIQVRPRGGTALKKGLTIVNTPGTVDSNFRGEIGILAINVSDADIVVEPGERIAQAVIAPVFEAILCEVSSVDETTRNEGAYNSTGTK